MKAFTAILVATGATAQFTFTNTASVTNCVVSQNGATFTLPTGSGGCTPSSTSSTTSSGTAAGTAGTTIVSIVSSTGGNSNANATASSTTVVLSTSPTPSQPSSSDSATTSPPNNAGVDNRVPAGLLALAGLAAAYVL